jgi:hypothetical protein
LNANAIEYLIVGGFAVGHHGAPRNTQDFDVLVNPSPEQLSKLRHTLREFAAVEVPGDWEVLPPHIIQMGFIPFQFHIMGQIDGVAWEEAWASRSPGVYGGVPVYYLGREALLKNKTAAGRDKDKADVKSLTRKKRA